MPRGPLLSLTPPPPPKFQSLFILDGLICAQKDEFGLISPTYMTIEDLVRCSSCFCCLSGFRGFGVLAAPAEKKCYMGESHMSPPKILPQECRQECELQQPQSDPPPHPPPNHPPPLSETRNPKP